MLLTDKIKQLREEKQLFQRELAEGLNKLTIKYIIRLNGVAV